MASSSNNYLVQSFISIPHSNFKPLSKQINQYSLNNIAEINESLSTFMKDLIFIKLLYVYLESC